MIGKNRFQEIRLERKAFVRIRAANVQRSHAVAFAFLDGNRDVSGLAVLGAHHGNRNRPRQAGAVDVLRFHDRIFHQHFEISVVLIETADADFQIFVQFWTVEGLRHNVNRSQKTERNRDGTRIAHGANDAAARKRRVARDRNLADFYFGAFVDIEGELHGIRAGDAFVGRLHDGELPAMLGQ